MINVRQRVPCDLVFVDRRDVDHHDRFRRPDADRWPGQPPQRLERFIRACVAHGVPACARSRRAASSLRRIRRVGEPPRCRCGGRRCSAPQDGQRRGACTSRRNPSHRPIQTSAACAGPGSVPGPRSVPSSGSVPGLGSVPARTRRCVSSRPTGSSGIRPSGTSAARRSANRISTGQRTRGLPAIGFDRKLPFDGIMLEALARQLLIHGLPHV